MSESSLRERETPIDEKIEKGSWVEVFGSKKNPSFDGKRGKVLDVLENTTRFEVSFDRNGTRREHFDIHHLRLVTPELLRYFNLPAMGKSPGGGVDSTLHIEIRVVDETSGKRMGMAWVKSCNYIKWSGMVDNTSPHWASQMISKVRAKLMEEYVQDGKGGLMRIVPYRPTIITCRDPGLLRVLKRGFEGNGTKVQFSFPDEILDDRQREKRLPLVEAADKLFFDMMITCMSGLCGMGRPVSTGSHELNVLYDEEIGGYVTEKTHIVPPISRVCPRCSTFLGAESKVASDGFKRSMGVECVSTNCHCDTCPFAFYCSPRCALDDEDDHEDECNEWTEHVDAACEVDYKSSNASMDCADGNSTPSPPPFRPTTEAVIHNVTQTFEKFDGYFCLADTSYLGGPDGRAYRAKILSPGAYFDEPPSDPVWVDEGNLMISGGGFERNPLYNVYARIKTRTARAREAARAIREEQDEFFARSVSFDSCLSSAITLQKKGTELQDEAKNYPAAIRQFNLAIEELTRFDMVFGSGSVSTNDKASRDLHRMKRKLAEILCSKAACHVEIANELPHYALLNAKDAIDDCRVALQDQRYVELNADLRVRLEFWLKEAEKLHTLATCLVLRDEGVRVDGNSSGQRRRQRRRRRRRKKKRNGDRVEVEASETGAALVAADTTSTRMPRGTKIEEKEIILGGDFDIPPGIVDGLARGVLRRDDTLTSLVGRALRLGPRERNAVAADLVKSCSFDVETLTSNIVEMIEASFRHRTPHEASSVKTLSTVDKQDIFEKMHRPVLRLQRALRAEREKLANIDDDRSEAFVRCRERVKQIRSELRRVRDCASTSTYAQMNADGLGMGSDRVDLHGLTKDGAKRILRTFVLPILSSLPLKFYLICGKGLHNNTGVATLRNAIETFLKELGVRVERVPSNDGLLRLFGGECA
eukprot:g4559.t1